MRKPVSYNTRQRYEAVEEAYKRAYAKRHHEDPRLPEHPDEHYAADWVDWHHFFGFIASVVGPDGVWSKGGVR